MNVTYNEFLAQMLNCELNLTTDTLKVALFPASYIPDPDQRFWQAIASQQVTGQNYAAGGQLLTGGALAKQDASNNVKFWADDVVWSNSTLTARYAVIYKDTLDPATSPLILCFDFGTDKSSVNGNFTVNWADDGIFTVSQAV
jgi:hypothetical protein